MESKRSRSIMWGEGVGGVGERFKGNIRRSEENVWGVREGEVGTLTLFPLLVMVIKSQSSDPLLFPTQEISTAETEVNKVYLWSTTSPPEVKQIYSPLQTVATRPPIVPNPYFSDVIQSEMEQHFRSENYPYIYDTASSYGYPVYPPTPEPTSVGPTSKHFVVVSFIGMLLLFAIIQNTILSAKRKDGLLDVLSRRKRSLIESRGLIPMSPEQEYILNDDAKLRCIQRTVCSENRKLFKDLGIIGKVVAKYLMSSIKESLDKYSGWDRLVEDAGAAGLRGEDCSVIYRGCSPASLNLHKKSHQDLNNKRQHKQN
ncbi:uncharacterized protein LOC117180721 [Belonocnema kinseyi]|uniref:uncharacterized protein LOC117180721 n=1 Tax=Belonocnema kinseyi TaxID=2817044 RepID=UPI00143D7569|nr:uncharacterized protein LOC117180721 [Belonocnema kinseyi]